MRSLALVELVCACFVGISFISQLVQRDRRATVRRSTVLSLLTFIWLMSDSLGYLLNGPSTPEWVLVLLNILVYSMSSVVLIGFLYYCEAYICEKTPLNKLIFGIPMVVMAVDALIDIVYILDGKIIVFEDGYFSAIGTVPPVVLATYAVLLFYPCCISYIKRKDVGRKSIFLMGCYGIPTILSIGFLLFTGIDLSVVAGSLTIVIVVKFLQDELASARLGESLTFTNFFLDTYISAYYVDLKNLTYRIYKSTDELKRKYAYIPNFFDSLSGYINSEVHPDDRVELLNILHPDNLRDFLKHNSESTHIFRDISENEERTIRLQIIRGSDENHVALGFADVTAELYEQGERIREAEESRKLIDGVASSYNIAYLVNISDDSFRLLRMDSDIVGADEEFDNFTQAKEFFLGLIPETDRDNMRLELDYNHIKERLDKQKTYTCEYRANIGGETIWHEMSVSYIDMNTIALGFVDKDREITRKLLSEKRFNEFFAFFVIDLDTEIIKVLKNEQWYKNVVPGDFMPYKQMLLDMASMMDEEPKAYFTELSDIDFVRNDFAIDDKRTFSYKSTRIPGGKWVDATFYVILRHEDNTPAMISLSFGYSDSFNVVKQELQTKINQNMQVIAGLAEEYLALFYTNMDDDSFIVYSLDKKLSDDSRRFLEGEYKGLEILRKYGQSELVHPDDRHLFTDIDADIIRGRLAHSKKYTTRFRRRMGDVFLWFEMDIVKYEDVDVRPNAIAIAFAQRDAEIRSEQALNRGFDVLSKDITPFEAVEELLAIIGEYYVSDRAFVFEYSRKKEILDNTYEWCKSGIDSIMDRMQNISAGKLSVKGLAFEEMRGTDNLLVVPIMKGEEIVGYLGVDNPNKAKDDIVVLRTISHVVFSEILRRKEDDEEHVTLSKLTDAFISVYYVDISIDYIRTWKIDADYEAEYGVTEKYSVSMGGYVRDKIAERDRERCIEMTSPGYILEQFKTKDRFSIEMTDIMLGYERDFVFDYIKVNDEGSKLVICCRDVTASLAREKEQQKLLQDALDAADIANLSKTNFLFNMSHDIRTPMNAIIGFNNMAIKHIDNKEKALDCMSKIKQSGDMLLALINSVLEVSRIESGKATLEEQAGDVLGSFKNLEVTMRELAEAKDISLSFEFGDIKNRYVYCDFGRLIRILLNVISNAVKYTREGGSVWVKCEQIGQAADGVGTYCYTVEDNGIGMSEEFQKHVFEQFARERTSTVSGIQGTGLGMAVCKSFLDLMGGTIECRSTQGKGSTFTITLPFKIQEGNESLDPATESVFAFSQEADTVELSLFEGKKTLLVEDNEFNREIAVEILEEAGIIVEEAADGAKAVNIIKEKGPDSYDFILMDIQMPNMGGYEATKIIRESYPDYDIPIIALSANAFKEDRDASIAAGMNDHVAKPINVKELFGILARFLK